MAFFLTNQTTKYWFKPEHKTKSKKGIFGPSKAGGFVGLAGSTSLPLATLKAKIFSFFVLETMPRIHFMQQ